MTKTLGNECLSPFVLLKRCKRRANVAENPATETNWRLRSHSDLASLGNEMQRLESAFSESNGNLPVFWSTEMDTPSRMRKNRAISDSVPRHITKSDGHVSRSGQRVPRLRAVIHHKKIEVDDSSSFVPIGAVAQSTPCLQECGQPSGLSFISHGTPPRESDSRSSDGVTDRSDSPLFTVGSIASSLSSGQSGDSIETAISTLWPRGPSPRLDNHDKKLRKNHCTGSDLRHCESSSLIHSLDSLDLHCPKLFGCLDCGEMGRLLPESDAFAKEAQQPPMCDSHEDYYESDGHWSKAGTDEESTRASCQTDTDGDIHPLGPINSPVMVLNFMEYMHRKHTEWRVPSCDPGSLSHSPGPLEVGPQFLNDYLRNQPTADGVH